MLRAAFVVTLGFAVLALLGGRGDVGVLSGTMPATWAHAALGLGYTLGYFAVLLVVPPLIAAGLATRFLKGRT